MAYLEFRFRWLNAGGQPTSTFTKKGLVESDTLMLDRFKIPVASIVSAAVRGRHLAFSVLRENGGTADIVLEARMARQVMETIGRERSVIWTEMRQKELQSKGIVMYHREIRESGLGT